MKEPAETIYDNLRFTHKVHEKQCELLSLGAFITRVASVILICAVLLLQFFQAMDTQHKPELVVWSITLTIIEVGIAFFQLNFNYDKLLDQHRTTTKKLLAAKNKLFIIKAGKITQKQLEVYVDELNDVYASAPQTNKIAKWLANREEKK